MIRILLSGLLALLLGFGFWACQVNGEKGSQDKIRVLCTTGIIADAVAAIGGDSIELDYLMGPGVDPHLYKASQGDLKKVQAADLIFYNGLQLEGKLDKILKKVARNKPVIALGESLPDSLIRKDFYTGKQPDPHLWFDLKRWKIACSQIAPALGANQPSSKVYFESRSVQYLQGLDSLHDWAQLLIDSLPEERRILVTAHDAFAYFGEAYGIEVKALQGISTLSEFGLRDVSDLVNFIIEKRLPAIFVENSVSEKAIRSVIEGCLKKGHIVKLGGTLYSDALGPKGSESDHFAGAFQHNVKTIYEALKIEER